ncbi:MAG: CoA-binding protein [Negativicutes bacterium]|nr:CoA-binding protein [Negativicutes bacterium]MDR3592854.1 CoA-binding protein [Negativicutes bacterium]
MNDQICSFLRQKVWAVVGASANPEKVGYKIVAVLRRYGYTVYAVNPKETSIDGEPCYPSLADLPAVPDAVDVVVPPAVALDIVGQCRQLGIKKVWFQLGVANSAVIAAAGAQGLDFVHGRCVMVESSKIFLLGHKIWAVVGKGPEAARLTQFLASRGYEAYPVYRGAKAGSGFAALGRLPLLPEAVVIAASGPVAEAAVRDSASLGLSAIWIEAGFSGDGLLELAVSLGLAVVHDAGLEKEFSQVIACRSGSPVT